MKTIQDFIEKYYPNYDSSGRIAMYLDLGKLLDEEYEEDDAAFDLLESDYGGDYTNAYPLIETDYNEIHIVVLEKSIQNFLDSAL